MDFFFFVGFASPDCVFPLTTFEVSAKSASGLGVRSFSLETSTKAPLGPLFVRAVVERRLGIGCSSSKAAHVKADEDRILSLRGRQGSSSMLLEPPGRIRSRTTSSSKPHLSNSLNHFSQHNEKLDATCCEAVCIAASPGSICCT